jgi:hypothetical protein
MGPPLQKILNSFEINIRDPILDNCNRAMILLTECL